MLAPRPRGGNLAAPERSVRVDTRAAQLVVAARRHRARTRVALVEVASHFRAVDQVVGLRYDAIHAASAKQRKHVPAGRDRLRAFRPVGRERVEAHLVLRVQRRVGQQAKVRAIRAAKQRGVIGKAARSARARSLRRSLSAEHRQVEHELPGLRGVQRGGQPHVLARVFKVEVRTAIPRRPVHGAVVALPARVVRNRAAAFVQQILRKQVRPLRKVDRPARREARSAA